MDQFSRSTRKNESRKRRKRGNRWKEVDINGRKGGMIEEGMERGK